MTAVESLSARSHSTTRAPPLRGLVFVTVTSIHNLDRSYILVMSMLNKYATKINRRTVGYAALKLCPWHMGIQQGNNACSDKKKYNHNVRFNFSVQDVGSFKTNTGIWGQFVWWDCLDEWQRRNTWALPVSLESWADVQNLLSELIETQNRKRNARVVDEREKQMEAPSVWRKTCKPTPCVLALSTNFRSNYFQSIRGPNFIL